MGVLRKQEKAVLKKVETTHKQAEQLIRRNKPLLKTLEEVRTHLRRGLLIGEMEEDHFHYGGSVGCPHCKAVLNNRGAAFPIYQCKSCAWKKAKPDVDSSDLPCTYASFGGVSMNVTLRTKEVQYIGYGADCEEVKIDIYSHSTCAHYREELEDVENAIKFVEGHIEWGEAILSGKIKNW